ncbi:MAG: glycosyltransferase [Acidobacteriota bacterium]|nr:glycosyltransferase [Acidobacteriota bacterium]MDH3529060.1 glycosyltransferase [Acidobacteriota bacterium]
MPKIAIVHDYFIQQGGAERVAVELQRLFPGAPMYTTVDTGVQKFEPGPARTSWMQNIPINERNHRHFFLLYPFAVESLDLSEYDIIISSTSGYAKGLIKRKDAIHICYCHTPMRWVWQYESYSDRENFGSIKRNVLPLMLKGLKKWDIKAAKRPDFYIANSRFIADRIKEYYGREAVVIPPPIDVGRFQMSSRDDGYYLLLSRLASYKRLDIAVDACRRMNRRLAVIGDGPARDSLEKLAGPKTIFLGRQSDNAVNAYAARCRALIFPGQEDFGMTPLEVNAAGRPVIAFKSGGAIETVVEGKTGVFFERQTAGAVAGAIKELERRKWETDVIRAHARKFDQSVFAERILEFVERVTGAGVTQTTGVSPKTSGLPAGRPSWTNTGLQKQWITKRSKIS